MNITIGKKSAKLPDKIGVCVAGKAKDNAEDFNIKGVFKEERWKFATVR